MSTTTTGASSPTRGHDHGYDYAEKHHRHYDLERENERLQGGLREVMAQVDMLRRELEDQLRDTFERIRALEGQTPQAQRLQLEADQAAADLAGSGYDRHGRDCPCSYCATDDDPADYAPEATR